MDWIRDVFARQNGDHEVDPWEGMNVFEIYVSQEVVVGEEDLEVVSQELELELEVGIFPGYFFYNNFKFN